MSTETAFVVGFVVGMPLWGSFGLLVMAMLKSNSYPEDRAEGREPKTKRPKG